MIKDLYPLLIKVDRNLFAHVLRRNWIIAASDFNMAVNNIDFSDADLEIGGDLGLLSTSNKRKIDDTLYDL